MSAPERGGTTTYLEAIRQGLWEEMEGDERVFLLGEDVGVYGGAFKVTDGFLERFGEERVIDTPISEAAIVGASVGAAMMGLRPVAEMQFIDFVSCGFDQLTNVAAKNRYRWGTGVPIVVRGPAGGGVHGGPFHSLQAESYFAHTAGLKVVCPSTPYDAKGLIKAAIRDDDPVVFQEHKFLYRRIKEDLPTEEFVVPLGEARLHREGGDLREIAEVKRLWPDHAVVASLMVGSKDEWRDIIRRTEDTGCDGFELNFGCPHGMCERGMGSAVGQEPRVLEEITGWAAEFASIPVLVKLTPNITDILDPAMAAQRGAADGVSLVNTFKSVIGVDRDTLSPIPSVGGEGTSGGYCGPAVKPIALHMVTRLGKAPEFDLPVSGIGGVHTWEDALDFLLLGASSVQVCTAAMHYGFRIVEEMTRGLEEWMREKGYARVEELCGRALPQYRDWGELDLNFQIVAEIDPSTCIGCQLCYAACEDGAHQCIALPPRTRVPKVKQDECVGCNLCQLVCPVEGCITMVEVDTGLPRESWNDRLARGTAGAGGRH